MTFPVMEFEASEDANLGSDDPHKKSIESAIAESRPITLDEYYSFMNAIGGLVPSFVVSSVPKLLFTSLNEAVRATSHSIDFLKNHPSLPVSFQVKQGVQLLRDYLQRQETFCLLQAADTDSATFSLESWSKYRSVPLSDITKHLCQSGKVELVRILLTRHFLEIKASISCPDLIQLIPVSTDNDRSLIPLLRDTILPSEVDIITIADILSSRARVLGDQDPQLAKDLLQTLVHRNSTTNQSAQEELYPFEVIRRKIIFAQSSELRKRIDPLIALLDILIDGATIFNIPLSIQSFSLSALLSDKAGCLGNISEEALREALSVVQLSLDRFEAITDRLSVDRIPIIVRAIRSCKSSLLSAHSTGTEDQSAMLDVVFFLLSSLSPLSTTSFCECAYEILSAVHSLPHLSSSAVVRFEEIAAQAAAIDSHDESHETLKMYLSIVSVTKLLSSLPEYSFVQSRPDFLMKRDNVMAVVADLSTNDAFQAQGLAVVEELARVFPYIDVAECVVMRSLTTDEFGLRIDEVLGRVSEEARSCVVERLIECLLSDTVEDSSISAVESLLGKYVDISSELKSDVLRIKCLHFDFGLSLSLSEIRRGIAEGKWTSRADFPRGDDIDSLAKLERAAVVFELPPEPALVDVNDLHAIRLKMVQADWSSSELPLVEFVRASIVPALGSFAQRAPTTVYLKDWADITGECSNDWLRGVTINSPSLVGRIDTVLWIHGIASGDILCDPSSDLKQVETFHSIRAGLGALTRSLFMQQLADVDMAGESSDGVFSAEGSEDRVIAKRAYWGGVLDGFSIPFDRMTLLQTTGDMKGNTKKILTEILPLLVLRSEFDLDLILRFGSDFDRSAEDVLVKVLEILLTRYNERAEGGEKLGEILRCLFSVENVSCSHILKKLIAFVLPAIVSADALITLIARVSEYVPKTAEGSAVSEWKRLGRICGNWSTLRGKVNVGLKPLFLLNGKESRSQTSSLLEQTLVESWSTCSLTVVEDLLALTESVFGATEAERITQSAVVKIITSTFAALSLSEDSVSTLLFLIEKANFSTPEESKRVYRKVIDSVPLSAELLRVVETYRSFGHGDVSEAEFMLLQNRLVLKKFAVSDIFEPKLKEINFSLRRLVELVYFNSDRVPGGNHVELVAEIVRVNAMDERRLRLDLLKRWFSDDLLELGSMGKSAADSGWNVVLTPQASWLLEQVGKVLHNAGPDKDVITLLLKCFFDANQKLERRLVAFAALMGSFDLKDVLEVYGNKLADLVEIEKHLCYLYLLCERNKVMKPMELKEFVALDKSVVVKAIVNSDGNYALLLLAAAIVVDYSVNDWDLVDRLEERMRINGRNLGGQAVKHFRSEMNRNGMRPVDVLHEAPAKRVRTATVVEVDENKALN